MKLPVKQAPLRLAYGEKPKGSVMKSIKLLFVLLYETIDALVATVRWIKSEVSQSITEEDAKP